MKYRFNRNFCIGSKQIGYGSPVFIIAEAGVAHFGSLEKAYLLIDLAVDSGADAVKFQIFKTDKLISADSKEWYDRLKSRELPYEAFIKLQNYCCEKKILFFATAHDEPSLEFLDKLDVPCYKIGSGEVDNWSFIEKVAARKKPIILSTGMYSLNKVGIALDKIAKVGNPNVAVLHCVTRYPTPPDGVNLRAMETIRETYDVITGYSDHTAGFHFSLAAAAMGAPIIEKHITLAYNIPDAQDWKASCGPKDFPIMIRQMRDIEIGLGSSIKAPGEAELLNKKWARKSLVAAVDILKGDVISSFMLVAKRPGVGISPAEIEKVVGKTAKEDIKKNILIKLEQLI